jgi:hypothetical protein
MCRYVHVAALPILPYVLPCPLAGYLASVMTLPLKRERCDDTETSLEEGTEIRLWSAVQLSAHRTTRSCRSVSPADTAWCLQGRVACRRGAVLDRRARCFSQHSIISFLKGKSPGVQPGAFHLKRHIDRLGPSRDESASPSIADLTMRRSEPPVLAICEPDNDHGF